MKKIALGVFLIIFAGCKPVKEENVKINAKKGEKTNIEFNNLAPHEALKISFTVHFLGSWDGTTYEEWSPDRFVCNLDNTTLIDSSFNNCFLLFSNNAWQSFPDPYHENQIDFNKPTHGSVDGTYLYHGGHGASAVASFKVMWPENLKRWRSVNTSYPFSFVVAHNSTNAILRFETKWKERAKNLTTYRLEKIKVEPLKRIPTLRLKQEEKAWGSFFVGVPDSSQEAWQKIFLAHPDRFLKRVSDMCSGNADRKKYLIAQLSTGRVLTESLYHDMSLDPNSPNLQQELRRIACVRELALGDFFTAKERHDIFDIKKLTNEVRAIRMISSIGGCCRSKNYAPLNKTKMRLIAYLRMINTDESHRLAIEMEK